MAVSPQTLQRQKLRFFVREVFRQLHPLEPPLANAWHIAAMCHALEEAFADRCPRLVINVPPRHLKSVTTSVAFCAWALGHKPATKILVGTYNEDLARQHDQQLRKVMESFEYRALFPHAVIDRARRRGQSLT